MAATILSEARWSRDGYTTCLRCGLTERPHRAKGLCVGCYPHRKEPRTLTKQPMVTQGLGERILRRIRVDAETGCWVWQRAVKNNGYAVIGWGGKVSHAHRASYEAFIGPVPEGLDIDHACHNADLTCPGGWACQHRRCVNPDHLVPSTRSENLSRSSHMGRTKATK